MYEEEKRGTTATSFIITVIAVSILTVIYLFLESEPIKILIIILLVLTVLTGGAILYWQIFLKEKLLKKKLDKLDLMLPEEAAELLKKEYLQIYKAYLKLSEKQKQNFYTRVKTIREKLAVQLNAEKRIQELLQEEGTLKERKKHYDEIHYNFSKLPKKVQDKYYPQIMQLKDELEHGK